MKNFMSFISLTLITILIFTSCTDTATTSDSSSGNSNSTSSEIDLNNYITYSIIEKTFTSNDSSFKYPQVLGLYNKDVMAKVNSELEKTAITKATAESAKGKTVDINAIKQFGEDIGNVPYLSYIYLYTENDSKNENINYSYIFSCNIDLRTGNRIKFSDMINSTPEFADLVEKAIPQAIIDQKIDDSEVSGSLVPDNKTIAERLAEMDANLIEQTWYFTATDLHIILPTKHTIKDDNLDVAISYDEALPYIKAPYNSIITSEIE